MTDSIRVYELKGLEDNFDDDLAKSILEIQIDKTLHPLEAVEKSLYNFDLETPEGVDRLLELLPILDPEIVNEVYQEIFPGYPVDTLAPRMARLELRGYLMDYLSLTKLPSSDKKEDDKDVQPLEETDEIQIQGEIS